MPQESFDALLANLTKENPPPRAHKRLKFVNRNQLDLDLMEKKLDTYLADNLGPNEMKLVREAVEGCGPGEARICEYILALIGLGEGRVAHHNQLIHEIVEVMRRADAPGRDAHVVESVAEQCSLVIYDSMPFLVGVKREIVKLAALYQVPFYYDAGPEHIRLRSSVLSTFKNLNMAIDDMTTLSEALWALRNRWLLSAAAAPTQQQQPVEQNAPVAQQAQMVGAGAAAGGGGGTEPSK